jgi:hypothetical protein
VRALDMFIPVAQRRTCCFSRSHTRLYERRSTLEPCSYLLIWIKTLAGPILNDCSSVVPLSYERDWSPVVTLVNGVNAKSHLRKFPVTWRKGRRVTQNRHGVKTAHINCG